MDNINAEAEKLKINVDDFITETKKKFEQLLEDKNDCAKKIKEYDNKIKNLESKIRQQKKENKGVAADNKKIKTSNEKLTNDIDKLNIEVCDLKEANSKFSELEKKYSFLESENKTLNKKLERAIEALKGREKLRIDLVDILNTKYNESKSINEILETSAYMNESNQAEIDLLDNETPEIEQS